ncbi:sigma-70 family RNA polymerase sigma factor [Reinekea thalattae]|uniref:Sigma-70 family RNA polymerase sigma factor n=1 Tax=Reinekea thalattae TaxID=2593301 RepID=A0A5C8ZB43_9GAMM|nr:sigma-70 family RNA polymerase sigma factor [Reinekea thalattae]TXR54411.1 sigma-70 family RNA polymerase sigma factor [Reinekea thalattae]
MENNVGAVPCALKAWQDHEAELLSWLKKTIKHDNLLPEDLTQEVFLKLLRQRDGFCQVTHTKAWLFRVAKNLLIDQQRKHAGKVDIDEFSIEQPEDELELIDYLAQCCLPRVLSEISDDDRAILQACDIDGMKQADYAAQHGLTITAVKSRLRRARQRLQAQLQTACQVQFDEQQHVAGFTARD